MKGSTIRARHLVLERTIRTYPEEEEAYEVASLLMWLLPLLVTVSAVLEFLILFLLNRFGHPWAGILADN